MPEGLHALLSPRPIGQIATDVLDIIIVAYLVYRVLIVLRGTRAMQMGVGLLALTVLYVVGKWLGLVTLVTLLSTLLSSIILVVVVIFQNDLRRGLTRAGARPLFLGLSGVDETKIIEEIIAAVTELARLRHGAIICWERDANLDEFIVGAGTTLDAQVTRELLVSIFIPVGENKLHDGAVVIRNLRIAQAGVFFPMPDKPALDKQFGSRHRAAIGITADTDAIAIVVSEERGTIMFCFQENHVDNVSPEALRNLLRRYEQPKTRRTTLLGPPSSRRSGLVSDPPPPLTTPVPSGAPISSVLGGPVSTRDAPPPTIIRPATTLLTPAPSSALAVRMPTGPVAIVALPPPATPLHPPVAPRPSVPPPPSIDPSIDPSVENGEEGPDQ